MLVLSQSDTRRQTEGRYDPEKLLQGEIACGRSKGRASTPCDCMKHRMAEADKRFQVCQMIDDKKLKRECVLAADACAIKPVDGDLAYNAATRNMVHEDPNWGKMPQQCKRSCTRARCECCHS